MAQNIPKISVVMPVYNAEEYLDESIRSVLHQTFRNFELIIICSDPSETTRRILEKYEHLDSRVSVHFQERKGIIAARNTGSNLARGEYIAVMDADDISYPNRFEIQVQFLDDHPDIGIVGAWGDYIDKRGTVMDTACYPTNPSVIGWHLLFENCMMNLTVLIRATILKELHYYHEGGKGFSEDYDLWTRAFFLTKIANIPESLAKYRFHSANNSINVIHEIQQSSNIIQNTFIKRSFASEYFHFLAISGLNEKSDLFTFNIVNNDSQVDFIEELYQSYIRKFDVTPGDDKQIRSFVARTMLRYAYAMVPHSKLRCLSLVYKSFLYSKTAGIFAILSAVKKHRNRARCQF